MLALAVTRFEDYSDRVLGPLDHVPEFPYPVNAPLHRVTVSADKDGWRKVTIDTRSTFVDAVRDRLTLGMIVNVAFEQLEEDDNSARPAA